MAADVLHTAASLSRGAPVTLVGHSLGGKVAMRAALDAPNKLAGIVVVDMAPRAYSLGSNAMVAAIDEACEGLRAVDIGGCRTRGEVDAALAPAVRDPLIRAFVMQNLVSKAAGSSAGSGSYGWRINIHAAKAMLLEALAFAEPAAPSAAPADFIFGGASPFHSPSNAPLIARTFANHALSVVDGAGHFVHADQPAAFTVALRRALVRQGVGSPHQAGRAVG
jgi:pimeloyl-ACP methyl ester carboxylesterase